MYSSLKKNEKYLMRNLIRINVRNRMSKITLISWNIKNLDKLTTRLTAEKSLSKVSHHRFTLDYLRLIR